jgi:hypothetical protein
MRGTRPWSRWPRVGMATCRGRTHGAVARGDPWRALPGDTRWGGAVLAKVWPLAPPRDVATPPGTRGARGDASGAALIPPRAGRQLSPASGRVRAALAGERAGLWRHPPRDRVAPTDGGAQGALTWVRSWFGYTERLSFALDRSAVARAATLLLAAVIAWGRCASGSRAPPDGDRVTALLSPTMDPGTSAAPPFRSTRAAVCSPNGAGAARLPVAAAWRRRSPGPRSSHGSEQLPVLAGFAPDRRRWGREPGYRPGGSGAIE